MNIEYNLLAEMLAELTPLVAELSKSDQIFTIQTEKTTGGYVGLKVKFQKLKANTILFEVIFTISNRNPKQERRERISLNRKRIINYLANG